VTDIDTMLRIIEQDDALAHKYNGAPVILPRWLRDRTRLRRALAVAQAAEEIVKDGGGSQALRDALSSLKDEQ
jgi:hypothetical protein